MTESVDTRFAPPAAHVEDVAVEGGAVLATRGARFWAALLDGVLVGGIGLALSKLPLLSFMAKPGDIRIMAVLVGYVIFLVVQGWWLVQRGQTIGKRLLGLRIVREDGSAADAWRLLGLRYGTGMLLSIITLVGGIYGIVDALLIFRESRKCLHDTIADTKVIKV